VEAHPQDEAGTPTPREEGPPPALVEAEEAQRAHVEDTAPTNQV
jgi:hypothetical protein